MAFKTHTDVARAPTDNPLQARQASRNSMILSLIYWGPVMIYLTSIWLVRPLSLGETLSLSLVTPGLLVIGLFLVRIPRQHVLDSYRQLGIEFPLLLVICVLSLLSLINSQEPLRSFRVIFPSLLPFAIFCQLAVLSFVSKDLSLRVPRLLIYSAFALSVTPFLLSFVLPPLKGYLFGEYRLRCFFENSIQHAIALGVTVPLMVCELALAKSLAKKVLWSLALLLMAYTMFRSGSKTPTAVSFAMGTVLYTLLTLRSRKIGRIVMLAIGLILLGLFLWAFGLTIAEKLNPIIAAKLRSIFEGGVSNYQSIESRKELWQEAIDQGRRHWLIGSGAGEKVLGISHAHNLILDYFKGIGVFGATAIALLCLTILSRAGIKALSVIRGWGDDNDIRILACYLGASIYVICNQLSDCFGPSTVGFLWLVYLSGRLSERTGNFRSSLR